MPAVVAEKFPEVQKERPAKAEAAELEAMEELEILHRDLLHHRLLRHPVAGSNAKPGRPLPIINCRR